MDSCSMLMDLRLVMEEVVVVEPFYSSTEQGCSPGIVGGHEFQSFARLLEDEVIALVFSIHGFQLVALHTFTSRLRRNN